MKIPTLSLITLFLLTACSAEKKAHEHREDWVIRSKVIFVAPDLNSERAPPRLHTFRLWFPYVAGDLYGAVNTGDFINPKVNPDYSFEIDLNRSHEDLLKSLEPTRLSISWLRIEPADARIARLSPLVMQADGIEPIGVAEWMDVVSKRRLTLVFFDRPARISGQTTTPTGPVRYDIQATQADYVWVAEVANEGGGTLVTTVHRPDGVLLAVTPKS